LKLLKEITIIITKQTQTIKLKQKINNHFLEWPHRYTLLIFLWFSNAICYLDRTNISVAIISMKDEVILICVFFLFIFVLLFVCFFQFGWDKETQGLVLSVFFWGYLCTQIIGSLMANKFGKKMKKKFGKKKFTHQNKLIYY